MAKLKQRVVYILARLVLTAANLLPERVSYGLAGALGRLFFRCSKVRQAHALRILRNAYPDEKDDRVLLDLARRATGNVFKVPLDLARVTAAIRRGRILDFVDVSQVRHLVPPAPFVGIAGHLGVLLDPVSSSAPTIILTLAVADSIHILVTWIQSLRQDTEKRERIRPSRARDQYGARGDVDGCQDRAR